MKEFHIGQRVKQIFTERYPDMTVEEFGELLNTNKSNVHNIFKRSSIQTEQLMALSIALQHDFFVELSIEMHRKLKERGEDLFMPKELYRKALYDNIMMRMSREVGQAITNAQLGGSNCTIITLNPSKGLKRSRILPNGDYRVYVIDGERQFYPPHIHIVVRKDNANIRIDIETGEFLGVVNQGYRSTDEPFDDIIDMVKQWLDEESFYEPGQSNREVARKIFHKINPKYNR